MQGLNRRYRLEFGRALNLTEETELTALQVFVPDEGVSIQSRVLSSETGHRIQFDIEKTASAAINKGTITLTNINEDMLGFITAAAGQEVYVKLEAATNQDPLGIIAIGTIVNITDKIEGTDRTTKLTLGDGYTPAKEAMSSISFQANEPYVNILTALQRDLPLPWGIYDPPPNTIIAKAPWNYSGNTAEGFRRVANELNYRYNITDGKINFVDRHALGPDGQRKARLTEVAEYTESSGLIGSPAALDKSSGIAQGSSEVTTGIRFKVLINPNLQVDSLVSIQSREFEGAYRITKLKHTGDWRGTFWYTECEALKLEDRTNPVMLFFNQGNNENIN